MKVTAIISAALVAATASAQYTYNATQAFRPGQMDKYKCLTTDKFVSRLPACLKQCQLDAVAKDGCPRDDYACRCINSQVFSDLIEPCAFPPALGGKGTCTLAELGIARPIVADLCNFFNATLYADYAGCGLKLDQVKTISTLIKELPAKITY